jgi:hypothetical protein
LENNYLLNKKKENLFHFLWSAKKSDLLRVWVEEGARAFFSKIKKQVEKNVYCVLNLKKMFIV